MHPTLYSIGEGGMQVSTHFQLLQCGQEEARRLYPPSSPKMHSTKPFDRSGDLEYEIEMKWGKNCKILCEITSK